MSEAGATTAIILAAGSGTRVGGDVPKQFRSIRGRSLIAHCYDAFRSHPAIDEIVIVIAEGQEEMAGMALGDRPLPRFITGGASRRQSVQNALAALKSEGRTDRVLIHDAARPFLSSAVIARLLSALDAADGAIPALPVVDTIARDDAGMLGDTAARDTLRRIQTPQAFHFAAILAAHDRWPSTAEATDDAQMLHAVGKNVALVEGDEALKKLTFPEDFEASLPPVRVGSGYDVHQLSDGEELWLCGIRIDHDRGLAGHSDADVAIHALVDAILGAVGAGDIGEHFPPSDTQWRGASSDRFLLRAMQLASEAGYGLGNADVTIVCEAPKLAPYRDAMRAKLAQILGVDIGAVSVKATTTEKLGFTGRAEGIAAQAIVSLVRN
ncbi:MAG: bifunctional 2-C-methyl-D-erythritol 4-phosphate cytidylyltransferase/2-C-methyl-D-erythritol 2,4-cyclodiphosphate synthase [Sphingomonadaceae bacterium]|nr:bifunctional 2-C-methyl-D-erythritol 4-phosphate cytidylyltransferase/2-C-methyl-D-erythritol 2,4-cyclodiphosphate synthase [Sphingomonadaceae bacterium]